MLAMQAGNQFENQLSGAAIEVTGGFICQEDLRLSDERSSQRKSLLFSSGKFAGAVMTTLLESNLTQPPRCFRLCGGQILATRQKRHRDVFQSREFGKKVVKLPYIADFAVTKLSGVIFRKRIHVRVCAVYGTCGGTIKRCQDVQ